MERQPDEQLGSDTPAVRIIATPAGPKLLIDPRRLSEDQMAALVERFLHDFPPPRAERVAP